MRNLKARFSKDAIFFGVNHVTLQAVTTINPSINQSINPRFTQHPNSKNKNHRESIRKGEIPIIAISIITQLNQLNFEYARYLGFIKKSPYRLKKNDITVISR